MNGFVNVLKPVGATASDVVVCLKHIYNEKAGHLGTLDPGASGVLPVAVGQATRLFDYLTDKTKYYRAFFTFGKTTDTLDAYGVVTARDSVPDLSTVKSVLPQFVGEQQQVPPLYSAISVGGVRAYKLARQGVETSLRARDVTVYEIKLVEQRTVDTFVVDVKCSGGTYIRSLARDIAASCGTVGYMSGLIRLASGLFKIEDAYTLDEIRANKTDCLSDITFPLADTESLYVKEEFYDDLDHGRKVFVGNFEGYRKIYCNGQLFGLGRSQKGVLKLDYYLKNAF